MNFADREVSRIGEALGQCGTSKRAKWASETRSILHMLNSSDCEHGFRAEVLAFILKSLPGDMGMLVIAGEVAFGSVNPDDRAPNLSECRPRTMYPGE